ncbi:uncharacterized protein LOC128201377 [Galleria mellonella]|uniref:Uncharacterized protein LOC128201377 n=1 Tax=Galleria mellonella TaxID=7137 RepID=A0ABM3MSC6_GALME|nr:uncharacterized protein LOC128201377 [Galleria mellonella]
MINIKRCKVRKFAQLIGLLVSACPAVEYGLLYTKQLERHKFLHLKKDQNYDKYMSLPKTLLPDFKWWLKGITSSVRQIRIDEYHLEIYTDASLTGWGATCRGNTASGSWSKDEKGKHINELELIAAFFGLKIFAKDLKKCQVLLHIDNSTAIAYINRMGGIQFPHLTKVAKDIWRWCEDRALFIYASYIKSADNVIADAESRRIHPDVEWELTNKAFQYICNQFGTPQVDLFASRVNTKCSKFQQPEHSIKAYPGGRSIVRTALLRRSIPPSSLEVMMASLSKNSFKQYDVPFKKWFSFCHKQKISIYEASIPFILLFFTEAYNSGCQYGTLNSYRSALSLLLGPHITKDDRVARFFKGVYRLRPPLPKYDITWDTAPVLDCLGNMYPNEQLSLENLTKKCATLLALASAHRVQTLALININNIEHQPTQISIKIPNEIKTSSRLGAKQPLLILPFFSEKPEICPSTTLTAYLKRTKNLRQNLVNLFVGYKKPHKNVGAQTISRWIKSTLHNCGIDVSVFTAHSTRHAATSKAYKCGVSVDMIRKTAGWSGSSNTFGKFYNRIIINNNNDGSLARAIINNN